ncbi:helix-turn-helix domain-containing protein [Vagococcus lutrae]|uniref:helix-turn-helix domain-containing protein n=1 Tax=Vagococcus lutrae TaxID=81947 RepID=UPI0020985A1C|nr:helix-turn-helix domain-containing protein [Vagococcus lutrae]MCO7151067.1 helix-turn-helix domain-containing protein [Vagococcus lutrae]
MYHNFELNIYTTSHDHFHIYQEVTILLVMEGKVNLVYEEEMTLKAGMILIINPMEYVEFLSDDEVGSYVELRIDPLYFTSLFPEYFHTKFECFPRQLRTGKREAILLLRKYVAELCLIEYGNSQYSTLKSSLVINQLLFTMVQHFQREHHYNVRQSKLSHKITEVLMYLSQHFREELTMEKLAALFYMSPASLSKQFKKETGMFFSHYLAKIRVKHSLIDLCYSSQTIEEVATKSGFSNSKTYRKQFREFFNVSPTEYRLSFQREDTSTQVLQKESKEWDQTIAQLMYRYTLNETEDRLSMETARSHKQLTIHPNLLSSKRSHGEVILQIGCLENLNSKSIQEEIKKIQTDMRVDYIGVQSLFYTIPLSYHIHRVEKMSAFPAFERLDHVMDFLEKHNLSVFYDIYLPTYQSLNQETKHARINFLRHLQNQYGEQVLGKWKINLIFDTPETELHASAFNDVVTICRSINRRLEIGAEVPLPDPYTDNDAISKSHFFVTHIVPNCQFLSYRTDPNEAMRLSEKTRSSEVTHEYLRHKSEFIRQMMYQWEVDLPLYLTEWNTLTGNTRNMNGTFFRGAIILKDILRLDRLVSGYGFWLNIDLFEQHRRMRPIANDSLELYHYYHSRRPAYFCLALAQRMQGEVLAESADYLLTKNGGVYQLLLWHTCYFSPDLSTEETFLQSQSIEYEWYIPEIPAQHYQIKQIDFSRKSGALFTSYHDFQSVHSLDYETQRYIATMTQPKIRVFDSYIDEGFHYSTLLDVNGVMLLELTPIFFEL